MRTLGELTVAYLTGRMKRREIAPTTARSYRDALRCLCAALGASTPVRSVTRPQIEAWIAGQLVAAATLRWRIIVVRTFFSWCVEEEIIGRSPCAGIRLPRKPRSVPRGLPDAVIARVLAAAADTREALMMSLMVREGLRSVEVSRLELGDVDPVGMTLYLLGKGGHQRMVPLTIETARLVEDYVTEERGRAAGRLVQARHKSVWNDEDGIKSHTVYTLVGRAFRRAGVPASGHQLRHSAAHAAIDAGADVRHVQALLGHTSIATTQVYLPRSQLEELRPYVGQKDYGVAS